MSRPQRSLQSVKNDPDAFVNNVPCKPISVIRVHVLASALLLLLLLLLGRGANPSSYVATYIYVLGGVVAMGDNEMVLFLHVLSCDNSDGYASRPR